jgi:hypothetical protein
MATAAAALEGSGHRAQRRSRPAMRVALSALVVAILGPLVVMNVAEALGASPTAHGQGFDQMPAIVSTSEGALTLDGVEPGAAAIEYVTVRTPSAAAGVELTTAVSGTGLDRFVRITVVRGSGTGATFRADGADHADLGPGVLYEGTLAGLRGTSLVDPAGSWRAGEAHTYRIVGTLDDTNAAQGLTASVDLAWTALPG